MKRLASLSFLMIFSAVSFQLFASAPLAPNHVRVCDKVNPVGTNENPYFGWYVNDADENEIQTAYQIVVATNPANLETEKSAIWNSAKVLSQTQNYIAYSGMPLVAATKYYWKVRTWDKDGNASPYSAVSTFETGLFTANDWAGAKWIKRNSRDADDYTYFRKKVLLTNKPIKRAIVYVSACHNYELFVNGKAIGKGFNNHYPQYSYYNAWDVTSAFTTNATANTLACLTHWYGGGQGRATGTRGLLLKTIIEYTDGTTTFVGTDSTWKQKQAEKWVTGQPQRDGEGIGRVDLIDSRKNIAGWFSNGFDDSAWKQATEIGAANVSPWINSLRTDLTRVMEEDIKPVSVKSLGGGKYVIDLGKIYPGMPHIHFDGGKAGDTVRMYGGFVLETDGSVSAKINQSTNLHYNFILNGEKAVFEPMVYLGIRYIQVNNSPNVLTADNVKFVCRHFELDPSRSTFTSSSPMLNQVWELMAHSLIVGAQEGFVDTPTREKGSFLGDGWSQAVSAMSTMGDRTMNNRVLNEFLDSQDQYWPDGRLNAVYPNVDGKRDIPDFTQSYLVWIWDYYMQTGNVSFLRANYAKLKKVADYVDTYKNTTTGLIHKLAGGKGPYEFGIIDWPPTMRYGYDVSVESRTVVDAYAYIDFDVISKVAAVLGNSVDQAIYATKAQEMRKAINTHLLNAQGVYVDGLNADQSQSAHVSQQANMLPFAMGIVPPDHSNAVMNEIKKLKMSSGMVTVRWLTDAVGQANEGSHLFDLYTNTEWDGWAKNITQGATVTWEAWDAIDRDESMSHPWGTSGLQAMQQYILGIKPMKPQHELIQVKPLDFDQKLTTVKGLLPTDRGDIAIEWTRTDKKYTLSLTSPVNMTARVYVPKCGAAGNIIKVNGVNVNGTEDGDYLFVENIGSGNHTFERAIGN